jgi:hypothetical protein
MCTSLIIQYPCPRIVVHLGRDRTDGSSRIGDGAGRLPPSRPHLVGFECAVASIVWLSEPLTIRRNETAEGRCVEQRLSCPPRRPRQPAVADDVGNQNRRKFSEYHHEGISS